METSSSGMRMKTWFIILICGLAFVLSRGIAKADDHEFRYKAPDAKSVELMCENNGWKGVPMTRGDDGVWTAKVSLSPGTYAYKFLIDGKDWMLDPNNSNKKSADGIENSAVEIK
jgi:1,4-alpha-glucan branching enzyme